MQTWCILYWRYKDMWLKWKMCWWVNTPYVQVWYNLTPLLICDILLLKQKSIIMNVPYALLKDRLTIICDLWYTDCTELFKKFPGKSITTKNHLRYWTQSSEEACAKRCNQYKSYNCQNFVFRHHDKACYIYKHPIKKIYSRKGRTAFARQDQCSSSK